MLLNIYFDRCYDLACSPELLSLYMCAVSAAGGYFEQRGGDGEQLTILGSSPYSRPRDPSPGVQVGESSYRPWSNTSVMLLIVEIASRSPSGSPRDVEDEPAGRAGERPRARPACAR